MKPALARLRAKTDEDLSILISHELKRAHAAVCRGDFEDAARGHESARSLMSVANISSGKRDQFERSLAELSARLTRPAGAVA